MSNIPWWGYVILAGLAWGTYVPIIFYGGSVLGGTVGSRLMAIDHHINSQNEELAREIEALRQEEK